MPNQWDLTNENIENTYQRVLQTPDGVNIYDGTGSAFTVTASPAGPDQSVQFRDGSATSGSSNFTFNKSNDAVTLTGSLNITGSTLQTGNNTLIGNTILSGSIGISGSSTIQGITTMTGSLEITGSTTQIGNNTLLGNTRLSGSIIISGAFGTNNPTVRIYGDTTHDGYIRFDPVSTNIDTSISASYIYVSGSTQDLYFSQNGNGYSNTTRLRWLEGNLYTGLLHGGLITATAGGTTFNISSGSGIIVSLNASINDDPYPTIKFVNWDNFTNQSLTYRTSSIQTFLGIDSDGQIIQQVNPWFDGQYNTSISLGSVLHQNQSTVNASITYPNVAYGYKQRTYDFIKAFGPLKLSGFKLNTSSSLGLTVEGGTAFSDGRNYQVDPNNPSYITDPGTTVSKIFRYYQSGSSFVQDTNNALGYTGIDTTQFNLNGVGILTGVSPSKFYVHRIFWYPNSATKGIVDYYGLSPYDTLDDAQAKYVNEPFLETPNTQQNAIFLGIIIVKGNSNFTSANDYRVVQSGLFRATGVGGGGGGGATTPGGSDHQIQYNDGGLFNGVPVLTYDGTTLRATGSFTGSFTGSLLGTASWADSASQALTASYYNETDPIFVAKSASLATTGSNIFVGNQVVSGSFIIETASSAAALRVTQTGTGDAIIVEDSANPDTTPFVVAADGRVGIGVQAPLSTYKLHVRNGAVTNSTTWGGSVGVFENSGSDAYLSVLASDTYNAGIGFGTAAHRVSANLYWNSTTKGFDLATNTASAFLTFGTDTGTERMRITSGGLVGIGTTTPSALLHVSSSTQENGAIIEVSSSLTASAALRITQVGLGNAILVEDSTNPDSTPFVVTATGNVGIGLTTPQSALHTRGNFSLGTGGSGNLQAFNWISANNAFTFGNSAGDRGLQIGVNVTLDGGGGTAGAVISGRAATGGAGLVLNGSTLGTTNATLSSSKDLVITSTGNIGLGINTPSYKLDVSGSARVTSSLYLPGLTSSPEVNVVLINTSSGQLYYTASSAIGGGGGGGPTAWGTITGDITAQSDLNTILAALETIKNFAGSFPG